MSSFLSSPRNPETFVMVSGETPRHCLILGNSCSEPSEVSEKWCHSTLRQFLPFQLSVARRVRKWCLVDTGFSPCSAICRILRHSSFPTRHQIATLTSELIELSVSIFCFVFSQTFWPNPCAQKVLPGNAPITTPACSIGSIRKCFSFMSLTTSDNVVE
jgi:hypothetical protein